jgi:hypothetical protein
MQRIEAALPDEAVSRAGMGGRALLCASMRERITVLTSQYFSGVKSLVAKCIVMLIQNKKKCKGRSRTMSINARYEAMKDSYISPFRKRVLTGGTVFVKVIHRSPADASTIDLKAQNAGCLSVRRRILSAFLPDMRSGSLCTLLLSWHTGNVDGPNLILID